MYKYKMKTIIEYDMTGTLSRKERAYFYRLTTLQLQRNMCSFINERFLWIYSYNCGCCSQHALHVFTDICISFFVRDENEF